MGILDFITGNRINKGVEKWKGTDGALLLDVREKGEYQNGHVPGAVCVPLEEISRVSTHAPNKSTPVYAYCESGMRSLRAVRAMKKMGYTNVTNIGGIKRYTGKKVSGKSVYGRIK